MKSKILDFIFGYEESERVFGESRLARVEKRFSDKVVSGLGAAYSKKVLTHPAVEFIMKLRGALAYASVRSYGILVLAFGIFTLLGKLAVYYFSSRSGGASLELTVGIAATALSLPMLFVDVPLNDFLTGHKLTDMILFDFLCIKKGTEINLKAQKRDAAYLVPAFIGAALAALGVLFSSVYVIIGALVALFVTLAFSSPEFSLLSTLMLLPLIPTLPHLHSHHHHARCHHLGILRHQGAAWKKALPFRAIRRGYADIYALHSD